MEQLATPGAIVVLAYTHRLTDGYFAFKNLGATQIKGVEEALNIYEVLGAGPLRTRLQVSVRRGLTRFVGRQCEMEQLTNALAQAKEGHGQIVGVMGEPGLGKSRLFHEFVGAYGRTPLLVLQAYSVSHGNGEVVADYLPDSLEWIVRAGHNLCLAEYRGYGMSTGHPALVGMLEDVVPIIQSLNIPDDKIVLFGRSIGSLYAMHGVYRRPRIAGLIIESGVADLTQRFFHRVLPEELGMSKTDVVDELRKYFDHARKLEGFQGKTLILHARFDELLDARHAETLYTVARGPKQLKIFDRGGHNDIFFRNRTEYVQLVEDFLAGV
jgi:hypothetical protein